MLRFYNALNSNFKNTKIIASAFTIKLFGLIVINKAD